MNFRMSEARAIAILRVAAVLALVALGLMVWSLIDPRPPPVLIAMSVGQALGTMSFAAFLFVVAWDLRRIRRALLASGARDLRSSSVPPPPEKGAKNAEGAERKGDVAGS